MPRQTAHALAMVGLLACATAQAEPLRWAEWREGRTHSRLIDSEGRLTPVADAEWQTPLGSLWKLFVYIWLRDQAPLEAPYVCRGGDPEEVYCCDPGQSIDRDAALLKSCGRYFEPARLRIDAERWRTYWQSQRGPDWLSDLSRLQPATVVGVDELLATLARLPQQAATREALSAALLKGGDGEWAASIGSRLRVKTWSWHRGDNPQDRIGGFAGWRSDGVPVWAQGEGSSVQVIEHHHRAIAAQLPSLWPAETGPCVDVHLFARYPLAEVLDAENRAATPGVLQGGHHVRFQRGTQTELRSSGEILLDVENERPRLIARLSREDYVARVLDREASGEPVDAARALAIVIRSYLQQQATQQDRCLAIDDSSATQRVAARPPSAAARAASAFSADWVLAGSPVFFHLDQAGENRLSWSDAVARAREGLRFDAILRSAFPRADLATWADPSAQCENLVDAERWLNNQLPRWRPRMAAVPGYDEPAHWQVCRLLSGKPYTDRARARLHVRPLRSQQDRLALTHEYLHLAFAAHPDGLDEDFVETWARRLILE